MAPRRSTQLDYGRRVARAMVFVAANLDAPLDLASVADAAAFSPCHFHRIFRAIAGETLAEHIARARLSRAARDLIDATLPMPRIARRAGYGSVAAFSRAFRAEYGVPPSVYRARRGIGAAVGPAAPEPQENTMYAVTIRDYPAMRIAVVDHRGSYHEIGRAFDQLIAWGRARGLLAPATRFFGRFFDDPKSVPEAACRSEACCEVWLSTEASPPVRIIETPPFRAAVLRFKGPYTELEVPYGWFYGTWLPGSGEEPSAEPCMEEYLNDPKQVPPPERLTDIIMPLKEKVAA